MKIGSIVTTVNNGTGIRYFGIIVELDGCEEEPWVNIFWNDGDCSWEHLEDRRLDGYPLEVVCK